MSAIIQYPTIGAKIITDHFRIRKVHVHSGREVRRTGASARLVPVVSPVWHKLGLIFILKIIIFKRLVILPFRIDPLEKVHFKNKNWLFFYDNQLIYRHLAPYPAIGRDTSTFSQSTEYGLHTDG